ncbi:MAG: amidohydrolase family protein [Erysipelotrichaceae bacterium]|nr:amidohydrolase family protein [Erysipelotrichaceae bacterium]MBQ5755803.1 amidohydrolase family protein [Erysipelotrichaceae bacterium]
MKTLIKNGMIYDGTGNKPYPGDVLLKDDRILKVAENIEEEAEEIIDAKGRMVCPGLIDAHSHNDFFYDRKDAEKYYKPFIEQGITTQITGNCSFSPFGMDEDTPYKDKIGGGLFEAEHPGSFKSFKERAKGNLYVNMAPLVGNGSVRAGMTGYDPKPYTSKQIEEEMEHVKEAMEGGALGGSFGFMYEPNRYSSREELLAFAKTIAEYDGIVTVHPRACSIVSADYPLLTKKSHLELGLDETVEIMKASGCRLEYSHLIFTGERSWKLLDKMLKTFYDARKEGYDIAYDNYAFHYGASVITVVFPEWYASLSEEERNKPLNKFKLSLTILMYRKVLGIDWEDMVVAYIGDEYKKYEGKTVLQLAEEEGVKPIDMYLKLVELSKRSGSIYLGKYYNDEIVKRLMEDELSVFMTDAWVEEKGLQNIAAFQTFPQFFLLAKRYGMPLEKIVRKMTGATADRYRLEDRGYLREGCKADITILDEDRLKVDESKPDFKPEGIDYVFINGKKVMEEGRFVSSRAGELILRKGFNA